MSNPTIVIIDAKSGEEIEREMNAEELAQWEADKTANEAEKAERAAKEAAKQAAQDKLTALGLTAEEIAAITGGN